MFREKQDYTTVIIKGERGIGKTKFWEEFRRIITQSEIAIYQTKCVAEDFSFQPLNDIVSNIFEQIKNKTDQQKADIFGEFGYDIIDSISPQLKDESFTHLLEKKHKLAGEKAKIRLFSAFVVFLYNVVKKPTIICFDDLHEADAIIFDWLRFAGRNIKQSELRLIGMYRLERSEKSPELSSLESENYVQSISLEKILFADTSEMVTSMLGSKDVDDKFIRILENKTGGNPLFIRELIFHLWEKGVLRKEEARWNLSENLLSGTPAKIEDMIKKRLDNLSYETYHTLKRAAVIGKEFELDILQNVTELSEDIMIENIIDARNSNLLENTPDSNEMQFIHDVVRETILNELDREEKKELHQKTAAAIESKYRADTAPVIDELAHHYYHAGNEEKTIHYCGIAGENAQKKYANEKAVLNYERVIEMAKNSGQRVEEMKKHFKIFDILLQTVKVKESLQYAEKAYDIAEEISDVKGQAAASHQKGLFYWRTGKWEKALDLFNHSLKLVTKIDHKMGISKSLEHIGVIYQNRGSNKEALEYFLKALKISEEIDNKQGIANCYGNIGIIHRFFGKYELALQYYNDYLQISMELDDKRQVGIALSNIAMLYGEKGKSKLAEETLNKYKKLITDIGDESDLAQFYYIQANQLARSEELDKALELYRKALVILEKIDYKHQIVGVLLNMGYCYMGKGEFNRAEVCFQKNLEGSIELGSENNTALAYGNLGVLYKNMIKYKRSIKMFGKAIEFAERVNRIPFLGLFYVDYAEILILDKQYKKARVPNSKGLKIVTEQKQNDAIRKAKLNDINIDFFLDPDKREKCISSLKKLLENEDNIERKGTLNTKIAKLYKEQNDLIFYREHLEKALNIYKEINKQNPRFKYKKEIEFLEESLTKF